MGQPAPKRQAEVIPLPLPADEGERPAPKLKIVRRTRRVRECYDTFVYVPGFGLLFSCEVCGTYRVPFHLIEEFMEALSFRDVLRSIAAR